MKIGILREEKHPPDERVALTPNQCNWIIKNFDVDLVVRTSDVRCFSDEEYSDLGIEIVENLFDCDVLIGVKEVPKSSLIANKMYFYFSHTIKKQEYNRELLQMMIDLNISMVDYEVLKNSNNERLLGFGRYAGVVGAYNALLTYGIKSKLYTLKPAHDCEGRKELNSQIHKIKLNNERIIVTGDGRVSNGVLELLKFANIREINKDEFLYKNFSEPVFCRLDTKDYNKRIDGSLFEKKHFYQNPLSYESSFMSFTSKTDIFIAGHFYGVGSPYLFTRDDVRSNNFNIKVVADISCDINGPVASTIKSSTIDNPIYGYNPITEREDDYMKNGIVAVMAVDNLPCELPKDSSKDFGDEFINKILPHLLGNDSDGIIERATICENGDLTSGFLYLRDYLDNN